MSYRGSSTSEDDGGVPEELRNGLAEIKLRISLLARQCEAITRGNGNGNGNGSAPHEREPVHLTNGVPEAVAHFGRNLNAYFARRLEHILSSGEAIDVGQPLNGRHPGAAGVSEVEKDVGKTPARDRRGKAGQLVDSELAEIRRALADVTQKIAGQTERAPAHPDDGLKALADRLAARLGEVVQELRSDFDSRIAALTDRLERQVPPGNGQAPIAAAENHALLVAQIDKIAAQLSDKYRSEAQSLERIVSEQLKRSLATLSSAHRTNSELFINEFVEQIGGRLAAIAETFNAELAIMRKNANAIRAEVEREIAGRSNRKRGDSGEADVYVKRLQEYLDRRVSEITTFNAADSGKNEQLIATMSEQLQRKVASLVGASRREAAALITELSERLERQVSASLKNQDDASQHLAASLGESIRGQAAKLGEVDRVVAAIAERVDGLIGGLAEAERTNLALRTALVGSLEHSVAALAEKGHADTRSLARSLESDRLELAELTRAEGAKTSGLIGSLDEKIAALAEKGQKDSAALVQFLQGALAELGEASRTETDRAAELIRSLEGKVGGLGAQTHAETASLAKALNEQIENQARRLTQDAQAESAKTAALVDALEQKLATLAQSGQAHAEAVAKALRQTIETRARELADNTRAETARTTSVIEALEKQIASSDESSRAETARIAASLAEKIAELAEKTEAEVETAARALGQQIERQVQELAEYTKAEAARTAALIGSLEQTVTAIAEKSRAESQSLAKALGEEIAGHVLYLSENARAANAKALELIGTLEDNIAALAKQSRADSELLARTLSEEIERRVQALGESTRADAAATNALFESRIDALSGRVQAETEQLANVLGRQIDGAVRQLAESAQAEAARTAARFGSLDADIAAMAEKGSAESAALAQTLTQQIESLAAQLGEKIRAEAATATAVFEDRIAALAESGKADTESLKRALGQQVDGLQESVSAAAERSRADSESLQRSLSQQIEARAKDVAHGTQAEIAKTHAALDQKIADLAESSREASESLARTLSQKIETHARELAESTRTEAIRTTDAIETKITVLAEKSQADTEYLAKTLGQQIEIRAREVSENTKAEAAKTTAALENKIGGLAEESHAEIASLGKTLSQQIESNARELGESARADAAKTAASLAALEEKLAAFAEKNRAALELQASALSEQLRAQLVGMSEASRAQSVELRKLLDTGIAAIGHSVDTFGDASRAEFQSQFKTLDERFHRRLEELSQQDVARTEALAAALRHKIDLGVAALIEGSKAEYVAFESLVRTLMDQIYRKVGTFTDNFRSEAENSHKKIDALRSSIDSQLEQFSSLASATSGLAERIDAAEAHIEAAQVSDAYAPKQAGANGKSSHEPIDGQVSALVAGPAEIIAPQDPERTDAHAHDGAANGGAIAAEINGGEPASTNGSGASPNGRLDGKSDGFHADDPCDPPIATPENALIVEESSKHKPRFGFARRLFGFMLPKH